MPICDLLRLVEDLEDPPPGRDRTLRLADPHAEHPQRHDEHREEEVEGEERTQRQRPRDDHAARREEHERLGDEWKERQQRDVERPLPVRGERLAEHRVRGTAEALRAPVLLRERLDDVDAGDGLLGDDCDLCERLLHLAQDRLGHSAVAVGRERDDRRDRERDERKLPAVDEEDRRDDEDRDDVLREEDEAVAEEEAHRLEVDRRARHELAGLAAVVEAEGQSEEMGVELVAQVVLDAERLPPGDDASTVHQPATDEPERHDGSDLEHEELRVLAPVELVDDDADEHGDEDRGDLRENRQRRRDDERRPVRAKKAEEAHERAPAAVCRASWLLVGHGFVGYGSTARYRSRQSGFWA